MMFTKLFRFKFLVLFVAVLSLYACGSSSSSSSGGGGEPEVPVEPPIGPDLNGDTWRGDFRTLNGVVTPLTATIVHEGNRVIIDTSLPDTGPEGRFEGTMSAVGGMLVFDSFDGDFRGITFSVGKI